MRPVPTKWETGRKISFLSYNQIHVVQTLSFKMIYVCYGCCLILGPNPLFTLRNSFVFYWFLKCSMSHISFSSLATCRSFCENRSHMWPNPTKPRTSRKTCFWVNSHKRWLAQKYFPIFKFVFSCLLSGGQCILSNTWKNLFKWDFFPNNKWWIKSVNPYLLL